MNVVKLSIISLRKRLLMMLRLQIIISKKEFKIQPRRILNYIGMNLAKR
jgi:hypothetical protein